MGRKSYWGGGDSDRVWGARDDVGTVGNPAPVVGTSYL